MGKLSAIALLSQFMATFMIAKGAPMYNPFEHVQPENYHHQTSSESHPSYPHVDNGLPPLPPSYIPHQYFGDMSLHSNEPTYPYGPTWSEYSSQEELGKAQQNSMNFEYAPSTIHEQSPLPLYQNYDEQHSYLTHGREQDYHPFTGDSNPSSAAPSNDMIGEIPQGSWNYDHGQSSNSAKLTEEIGTSNNRPPRLEQYQWQIDLDVAVLDDIYKKMFAAWSPSCREYHEKLFHRFNDLIEKEPELLPPIIQGDQKAIIEVAKELRPSLFTDKTRATSTRAWTVDQFLE